ncbi:MAG: prepilin-type N-terminal cleavage/methylation domain-containing protein [Rickettsiales bacterium]
MTQFRIFFIKSKIFFKHDRHGFSLIEMSIVLAVIALIVGGVLVGKTLIDSSRINAQIAQIEKYKSAVNLFKTKYNYMPGDMPDPKASSYGFHRSTGCNNYFSSGCGNGNGTVDGAEIGGEIGVTKVLSTYDFTGETHLFWLDLIDAELIGEKITEALNANTLTYNVKEYLPAAKIGNKKYVHVWSNGIRLSQYTPIQDGKLYFALSEVNAVAGGNQFLAVTPDGYKSVFFPTIKAVDAYNIDSKIDDGLPQSGDVIAAYPGAMVGCCISARWVGASHTPTIWSPNGWNVATTKAVPASDTTCYDNNNTAGEVQKYSMAQNGGNNETCAISFRHDG